MNRDNFGTVSDFVAKTGAVDGNANRILDPIIKDGMEKGSLKIEPSMTVNQPDGSKLKVTYDIGYSDARQRYEFNGFRANLKREGEGDISNFFSSFKGKSHTIREAGNLLDGRWVFTTGEDRNQGNRYVALNFDQITEKGQFRKKFVSEEENKMDYSWLLTKAQLTADEDGLKGIISQLKRGDRVQTEARTTSGAKMNIYLETLPAIAGLKVSDLSGNELRQISKAPEQSITVENTLSQGQGPGRPEGGRVTQGQTQGQTQGRGSRRGNKNAQPQGRKGQKNAQEGASRSKGARIR